jgi:hypothetical protein
MEGLCGLKAVRRSWTLTQNSRWRIFITWIAIASCSLVLQTAIQFLIQWAAILPYRSLHHVEFSRSVYATLIYVAFAFIHAAIGPLYPIALTLFYYDQLVRKEGYDLAKMLQAACLEPETGDRNAIAPEMLRTWGR